MRATERQRWYEQYRPRLVWTPAVGFAAVDIEVSNAPAVRVGLAAAVLEAARRREAPEWPAMAACRAEAMDEAAAAIVRGR